MSIEQDLAQLEGTGLAEGVPLCRTCNQPLTEGQHLTVYARRTTDTASYELGQVTCFDHQYEQIDQFETEVRELVVEGRVGYCTDHALQSSWPVLLHPQARVISPLGSAEGYRLSGDPWFRSKIAISQPDDTYRDISWTVSPKTSAIKTTEVDTSTMEGGETDG